MTADTATDRLQEVAPGVYCFDTHYVRPGHTCCYIVVEGGRAALVDCGLPANVPALLSALAELGVAREAVDWVLPTHAHLDHAGASGQLMRELPRARLAAHPSAAPHLIDPTRLEAGVRALYGDDYFDQEYAPLVPVDAERVVETPDEDTIDLAGRTLRVIHTPGHAWHHQSLLDTATRTMIAGDSFGVGYQELLTAEGPVVLPVVPPPQFKPELYKASVQRIVDLAPERVAITHFGLINDVRRVGADLCRLLDAGVDACWQAESEEALVEDLKRVFGADLERRGRAEDVPALRDLFHMDIWLSAEGMWLWRRKQEQRAAQAAGGEAQ